VIAVNYFRLSAKAREIMDQQSKDESLLFKVVWDDSGSYRSAIVTFDSVSYALGRITRPCEDAGPLCAFGKLQDALNFTSIRSRRLLLCKAKRSAYREVWYSDDIEKVPLSSLLPGTILADWLTPLIIIPTIGSNDD
jgi:hypothetical protein